MQPSPHTKLINFIIGLCKKNTKWVCPFGELGYKVQLIEQSISIDGGQKVKPDVIPVSNKQLNALVFECKGGTTLKEDQIIRYRKLTKKDLLRWIDVFTEDSLTHDICLAGYENSYDKLKKSNTANFPMLSFSKDKIKKSGTNFIVEEVEEKFANEIDISGMIPPLSYYPFSELDDKGVIVPYVLRAVTSLIVEKKRRGKTDALDKNIFASAEVLRKVHPLWDILSIEHQHELQSKVQQLVDELQGTYARFKENIVAIQESENKSTVAISNLIEICEEIIKNEESKIRITDF